MATFDLDSVLYNYNNYFLFPEFGEKIENGSSLNGDVYTFLSSATTYYIDQVNNVFGENNTLDSLFNDKIQVTDSTELYEISQLPIKYDTGFGWFIGFLLNALYPLKGKNFENKQVNNKIYKVAFENYCSINQANNNYGAIDTDDEGKLFLKEYKGILMASIIFAKFIGNDTYRGQFKTLKSGTYTNNALQGYYFCDGKRLFDKGEDGAYLMFNGELFVPKPPTNGQTSWIWNRDVNYHHIGGQQRGYDSNYNNYIIGTTALEDRNGDFKYWMKSGSGILSKYNSSTHKRGINTSIEYGISMISGSHDSSISEWKECVNSDHKGLKSSLIGYDYTSSTSNAIHCLLKIGIKSGNRLSSEIKDFGTSSNGWFRKRPFEYFESEVSPQIEFPHTNGYGKYENSKYYYDTKKTDDSLSEEVTGSPTIQGTSSYPSSHTALSWNMALLVCATFSNLSNPSSQNDKDDLIKLLSRSYLYGENRNIVGAHWQQCIDIGRITSACSFAMMCGNYYFIELIDRAHGTTSNLLLPNYLYKPWFTNSGSTIIINKISGAQVYYTTDGSDPTTSSSIYSSGITISQPTTIKAIAVKDGITSNISVGEFDANGNQTGGDTPGGGNGGSGEVDTTRPYMKLSTNSGTITVSMASSVTIDGKEVDVPWGGVGHTSKIRYKRDIIDQLNLYIKPIKNLQVNGMTYNLLTSYAYFHNDICADLRDLWEKYEELRNTYTSLYNNYQALSQFRNNYLTWQSNNSNKISNANSLNGQYLWTDYVEGANPPFRGDQIQISIGQPPVAPDINENYPNITLYNNYEYTWEKQPYKYINMTETISYSSNIKPLWQTLTYSMMKWKNNRYEHHMSLIM